MYRKKTITAIILAAGNSTRYGKNKILEQINKKNIISYSLEIFNQNPYIDNIVIATQKIDEPKIRKIIKTLNMTKPATIIIGGSSRKQSVYNCLKAINSNYVIIHDGARPLIKQEYINNCLKYMTKYKGVTLGVPTKDTIKITNSNNIVIETTDRQNTWLIQTPQCFDKNVLVKMHEKNPTDTTDDCSLLEKSGYKIKIIEGDYTNIKLTTPEDYQIIKIFLNKK